MGMIQEFKEFAVKGNMIDMAVGIIVGATFGKVVPSLVSDVIKNISRNPAISIIFALALVFGAGGMQFGFGEFTLKGIGLFAITAIILNIFLSRPKTV